MTAANQPPAAATCISCGAPWGSPHLPSCKFTFALHLLRWCWA